MFSQVWSWAGTFRKTGKNIGIEAYKIAPELRKLCDDVDAWIEYGSYPNNEIAARFHHRLVYIHLFPNGNGRHARLATDALLIRQLKQPAFTWGRESIDRPSNVRQAYVSALREADKGNYQLLLDFVTS